MGLWHKDDDFIKAYSERAGVSTDEAAKVAEVLKWIFCVSDPSEIELDGLVNSSAKEDYESSIKRLEEDVSRLEKDLDNLEEEKQKEIDSLENEIYALKEKLEELEDRE